MRSLFALLLGIVLAASVFAKEAAPAAADPILERRAMALAEELRCLVCQNQSIADSHAELAIDLKNQIREKMKAGMGEKQIIDYMVARYGDFVLYRPPVKATTLPLWLGPFVVLVAALAGLFYYLRRRRTAVPEQPLSEAERARCSVPLRRSNDAVLVGGGVDGRPGARVPAPATAAQPLRGRLAGLARGLQPGGISGSAGRTRR
jgi:cytochrome c-type biogenesis protein CcmH